MTLECLKLWKFTIPSPECLQLRGFTQTRTLVTVSEWSIRAARIALTKLELQWHNLEDSEAHRRAESGLPHRVLIA